MNINISFDEIEQDDNKKPYRVIEINITDGEWFYSGKLDYEVYRRYKEDIAEKECNNSSTYDLLLSVEKWMNIILKEKNKE